MLIKSNYCTGSIFNEKGLADTLPGELKDPFDNETIAVKFHHVKSLSVESSRNYGLNPTGCLFILRNLKDAILADFTRRTGLGQGVSSHSKQLNLNDLEKPLWVSTKKYLIERFRMMFKVAIPICRENIHIINFEKLKESKDSLIQEMSLAVDFIQRNNPKMKNLKFRKSCLEKNSQGSHLRNKTAIKLENYFSDKEKLQLNLAVDEVSLLFADFFGREFYLPDSYKFENF